jgi:hypothetical protein
VVLYGDVIIVPVSPTAIAVVVVPTVATVMPFKFVVTPVIGCDHKIVFGDVRMMPLSPATTTSFNFEVTELRLVVTDEIDCAHDEPPSVDPMIVPASPTATNMSRVSTHVTLFKLFVTGEAIVAHVSESSVLFKIVPEAPIAIVTLCVVLE